MRSERLYLKDILEAIKKIQTYTHSLNKEQFLTDYLVQDAVIRNLEIIGEAASKIKELNSELYSQLKLNQAKGMRNVLIHDYNQIDPLIVWQTVQLDIPMLEKLIVKAINLKGRQS